MPTPTLPGGTAEPRVELELAEDGAEPYTVEVLRKHLLHLMLQALPHLEVRERMAVGVGVLAYLRDDLHHMPESAQPPGAKPFGPDYATTLAQLVHTLGRLIELPDKPDVTPSDVGTTTSAPAVVSAGADGPELRHTDPDTPAAAQPEQQSSPAVPSQETVTAGEDNS
jgi:hypothetical protein